MHPAYMMNYYMGGVYCLLFSLALRGFSQGTPVFPSPQKPTLPNSIFDKERYTENHYVDNVFTYSFNKLSLIKPHTFLSENPSLRIH